MTEYSDLYHFCNFQNWCICHCELCELGRFICFLELEVATAKYFQLQLHMGRTWMRTDKGYRWGIYGDKLESRLLLDRFPAWLQKSGGGPMPRKGGNETVLGSARFRCSSMGECDTYLEFCLSKDSIGTPLTNHIICTALGQFEGHPYDPSDHSCNPCDQCTMWKLWWGGGNFNMLPSRGKYQFPTFCL